MNLIVLPQRDYLTRRELADRYNVSVRMVDRWTHPKPEDAHFDDPMPVERWTRRLVRFRVVQTDGWLERRSAA